MFLLLLWGIVHFCFSVIYTWLVAMGKRYRVHELLNCCHRIKMHSAIWQCRRSLFGRSGNYFHASSLTLSNSHLISLDFSSSTPFCDAKLLLSMCRTYCVACCLCSFSIIMLWPHLQQFQQQQWEIVSPQKKVWFKQGMVHYIVQLLMSNITWNCALPDQSMKLCTSTKQNILNHSRRGALSFSV